MYTFLVYYRLLRSLVSDIRENPVPFVPYCLVAQETEDWRRAANDAMVRYEALALELSELKRRLGTSSDTR